MLLDAGADVNCRDGVENTAIMVAAAVGHNEVLRILANHPQVDLNAQVSCFGMTSIQTLYACNICYEFYDRIDWLDIVNSSKFLGLSDYLAKMIKSLHRTSFLFSHKMLGLYLYAVYPTDTELTICFLSV